MTLADELERLLLREPSLTAEELYARLGRSKAKVRSAQVVRTVLTTQRDRFVECSPGKFAVVGGPVTSRAQAVVDGANAARRLELDLRDRLRGRRMVSEIGLDAKLLTEVEDALADVIHPGSDPLDVAASFPALISVYLVAHGIYRYRAGSYWNDFGIPSIGQPYGKAFESAVRRLDLESFDDMVSGDQALPFVSPILAHGGIPGYCLDDFFELVAHGMRQGASNATSLMTTWRTRRSAFANIDKPVRRFLMFGGDLSRDFLDRCIDLIREWSRSGVVLPPAEVGLPAYVVTGFRKLTTTGRLDRTSIHSRGGRLGVRRPSLVCDPWEISGPCIKLARFAGADSSSVWTVVNAAGIYRERASSTSDALLPVGPARQWAIQLHVGRELVSDTIIEGIDEMPALLFDSTTGDQVAPGMGLSRADVVVLRPGDKTVRVIGGGGARPATVLESLPEPTGPWSGYVLERIDLADCSAVEIGNDVTQRRISVRSVERPALDGRVLEGSTGADGSPVYTADVSIRLPQSAVPWTVRVAVDGTVHEVEPADCGLPRLGGVLPVDRAALVRVLVRGVIGSDLRTQFTWIPGLDVTRPDRLALPGEPAPSIQLSCPDVAPVEHEPGAVITVRAPMDGDSIDLTFPGSITPIGVRIHVPRLMWGTVNAGMCTMGVARVQLSTLDFAGSEVPGLAVTTGERDTPVSVVLSCNGRQLQRSDKALASGARGQCRFDLARFADTVSRLDDRAEISLLVGQSERPVGVGVITPEFDVSQIEVNSTLEPDRLVLDVSFNQPRPVRHRVVRLWSLARVWDDPVVSRIPDDAGSDTDVTLAPPPPPGPYLVEIAVDDGWTTVTQPDPDGPSVTHHYVGDEAMVATDLVERSTDDPRVLVESIMVLGRPVRPIMHGEVVGLVLPALMSWADLTNRRHLAPRQERSAEALLRILHGGREHLAPAVEDLAAADEVEPTDLLRLAVEFGPAVPHDGRALPPEIASVWQLEPALGAMLELGKPLPDGPGHARDYLGWGVGDSIDDLDVGEWLNQQWLGMRLTQLEGIRAALQFEVLPRTLTKDALGEATLEWLGNDKRQGGGVAERWRSEHRGVTRFELPTSPAIRAHLSARSVPKGTEAWGLLPQLTLAAALHICARTDGAGAGRRALLAATRFAPLQVRRDLILARVLVIDLLGDNDLESLPTERIL